MSVLQPVAVPVPGARLAAEVTVPACAAGLVVIARGTGSCRHDPGHRALADHLSHVRLGSVLVDLLGDAEERAAQGPPDPGLLAERLAGVAAWTAAQPLALDRPLGLVGTAAGAGAALAAAARAPGLVRAVAVLGPARPDAADGLRAAGVPVLALPAPASGPAAWADAGRWLGTVLRAARDRPAEPGRPPPA